MPPSLPRLVWLVALLPLTAGCDSDSAALATPGEPAADKASATVFNPLQCGRVEGRVTWSGPVPEVQVFPFSVPSRDGSFDLQMMPNPNQPRITPETRAVAGAVVFLRGVDAGAAKPWDLPPVRVVMQDFQIRVYQGDAEPGRVGFVRRGEAITMLSAEPVYHLLRGRGAAFFSLTFPDPHQPLTRILDRAGRVDLTSGAGYYWANADLFVDDHPYYTVTDPDGRFVLDQVPAGDVELVAWLPGWEVARQERDPESGMTLRQSYTSPREVVRMVQVDAARSATVDIPID